MELVVVVQRVVAAVGALDILKVPQSMARAFDILRTAPSQRSAFAFAGSVGSELCHTVFRLEDQNTAHVLLVGFLERVSS